MTATASGVATPVWERGAPTTLAEGRYQQLRGMFAAGGNHVHTLQRLSLGGLTLDGLEPGQWRVLDATDLARVWH